jgi:hypothetical protein
MEPRGYPGDLLTEAGSHARQAMTSSWPVALVAAVGAVATLLPHPASGSAPTAVAIDWATVAGKAAAVGLVAWFVIAIPMAFVRAYAAKHAALADALSDLETERDTRPKLSATIIAAFCHGGNEPDTWVTQTAVDVRNAGQKAVRLDGWQTLLEVNGAEFPGRPNESLIGSFVNIDHKPVPQIKTLGQIGGLDFARGTIVSTVYGIPAGTNWHNCIVKVRVHGVGSDWSEWAAFQPPGEG